MTGSLRAKFHLYSVTHNTGARLLEMTAVYGKDGSVNGQWSKATPVGKLTMTVTNEAAFPLFDDGAEFGPGTDVFLEISVATPEE